MPPNYAMNAMARDPSPEAKEALRLASQPLIYLVTAKVEDYPVKVGFSTKGRLAERFIQLQICMPYDLDVMMVHPGDKTVEAELHERFNELHLRGEWFKRGALITSHIIEQFIAYPDWDLDFLERKHLNIALQEREAEDKKNARKRVPA